MLYLINCSIIKTIFDEEFEEKEMNHIVEAESKEEVYQKVRDFYSKINGAHTKYHVTFNYTNEIIK